MTTTQAAKALREQGWEITAQRPGVIAAKRLGKIRVFEQTSAGWVQVGGN